MLADFIFFNNRQAFFLGSFWGHTGYQYQKNDSQKSYQKTWVITIDYA
jgi:hypothetical protein